MLEFSKPCYPRIDRQSSSDLRPLQVLEFSALGPLLAEEDLSGGLPGLLLESQLACTLHLGIDHPVTTEVAAALQARRPAAATALPQANLGEIWVGPQACLRVSGAARCTPRAQR